MLALELVSGRHDPKENFPESSKVLEELKNNIEQKLIGSGELEISGVLDALEGKFIPPGPSGAPSRGRPDVLPTGRNFYSVDTRTIPTPTAWKLGWKAAGLVIDRFRQENGEWPKNLLLSAWGTANMRTGGDDIAQVLALLGVCPEWEPMSGRVTGFKIIPYTALGRPRVDVTLRISGFFRDAFPYQVELIDTAIQRVAGLEEPEEFNPLAALATAERINLSSSEANPETAFRRSTMRIFGSKPGAYGAGLQSLIDEGIWETQEDFATAYLKWGSFVYGKKNWRGKQRKNYFGLDYQKFKLSCIIKIIESMTFLIRTIIINFMAELQQLFVSFLAFSRQYITVIIPDRLHQKYAN